VAGNQGGDVTASINQSRRPREIYFSGCNNNLMTHDLEIGGKILTTRQWLKRSLAELWSRNKPPQITLKLLFINKLEPVVGIAQPFNLKAPRNQRPKASLIC
jgi:hypothetical protein